jgi:hypothetical protein
MRTCGGVSDRRLREKLYKQELRALFKDRSFVICTVHRIMCGSQMEDEIRRARQVAHAECCHGNEKERDHLGDAILDERIILK